jgi:hypothetical protein
MPRGFPCPKFGNEFRAVAMLKNGASADASGRNGSPSPDFAHPDDASSRSGSAGPAGQGRKAQPFLRLWASSNRTAGSAKPAHIVGGLLHADPKPLLHPDRHNDAGMRPGAWTISPDNLVRCGPHG